MSTQKVIQCLYCGNKTLMDEVGCYKEELSKGQELYYEYFKHSMFLCPICKNITFHQEYSYSDVQDMNKLREPISYFEENILYPVNTFSSTNLPQKVKEAYESTLKIKNIDKNICLAALRRTIEGICKDKNCEGNTLEFKIDAMYNNGILPIELKEASKITKNFGNIGAHLDDTNLSNQELEDLIRFVEYILEYIYILPEKMKQLKEKL